jgi:hypothetical protein
MVEKDVVMSARTHRAGSGLRNEDQKLLSVKKILLL